MLLSPFVGQQLRAFVANENAETLQTINGLVAAGKVSSVLSRSYSLAEAADAVARLEAGSGAGRLVLTV
jgi:NADPH:quinone reductase-like Zn-dependent oxidoreductase